MPRKAPLAIFIGSCVLVVVVLSCRVSQEKVDVGKTTFCDQLRARLSATVLVNEAMVGIQSNRDIDELNGEIKRFVSEIFGDREGGTLQDLKDYRAGSKAYQLTCHYALREMQIADSGSLTLDMFRLWQLSQCRDITSGDGTTQSQPER